VDLNSENCYVKFEDLGFGKDWTTKQKVIIKVLSAFLPLANPDFEGQFVNVKEWYLEFVSEFSTPNREIGLDKLGNIIVVGPYGRNMGFWTDSIMKLEDLKKIAQVQFITQQDFDDLWNNWEVNDLECDHEK
jgi:hypothetical protein